MSRPSLRLSQRAQRAGGQPIAELMHRALAQPELISLAAGFVDQATLPTAEVAEAFAELWRDPPTARAALQYGSTGGSPRLREQLLDRLEASDGDSPGYRRPGLERLIVTTGSNQLLYLLVDTLCEPGDVVVCPAPTYFVFLGILRQLGVRAVGVATDAGGLIPEALADVLRHLAAAGELPRVKALYLGTYFDNPTGISLAPDRRAEVLSVLERWASDPFVPVIEDIAYRQLRYAGADQPTLWAHDASGARVILTDTFSKCLAPGLRLGYAVLPPELAGPVHDQKGNIDFGSPHLSQQLLSTLLDRGTLGPHVERLRLAYRAKRDAMLAAAERHLAGIPDLHWVRPTGGLYVWLTLPPGLQAGLGGPLFDRALQAGVLYVPGEYAYPVDGATPVVRHTIRLSYGVQSPERIALGMEKLGHAIRQALNEL